MLDHCFTFTYLDLLPDLLLILRQRAREPELHLGVRQPLQKHVDALVELLRLLQRLLQPLRLVLAQRPNVLPLGSQLGDLRADLLRVLAVGRLQQLLGGPLDALDLLGPGVEVLLEVLVLLDEADDGVEVAVDGRLVVHRGLHVPEPVHEGLE